MVDVSDKAATKREAEATAMVEMSAEVLAALPRTRKGIRWKSRASPVSRLPSAHRN